MKTSSLILTLWPKKQNDNLLFKVGKVASLVTIKHKIIKNWVHNTLDEDQRFNIDICSPDLKINIEYLLSRGNLWSNLLLSMKKVLIVEQTTFFQRRADWHRPLIMWQKIKWEHLFSKGHPLYQILQLSSKDVKRFWADIFFFKDQQFDLDLWACDLKIKMAIYSLWALIASSLANIKGIEKRSNTAPSFTLCR